MKKFSLLIVTLIILTSMITKREHKVTGVVTSAEDGNPIPGVTVVVKGTTIGTITDIDGKYSITTPSGNDVLSFSFIGYVTQEVKIKNRSVIKIGLEADFSQLEEVVVTAHGVERKKFSLGYAVQKRSKSKNADYAGEAAPVMLDYDDFVEQHNTEEYDGIRENLFHQALRKPLSTFSIDVDAASYSNMRRFLNNGQQPPKDAVRIEEMVNYFNYDYDQPKNEHPFSINTEISSAPWNAEHKLVHIGLQGKKIATENLPPSNLVFLLDVSGSMSDANKLPLLKSAFRLLVEELRPEDLVSIVVYAGAAGVVLPPTSGKEKSKIISSLSKLEAGGSTAGGAGIQLAYKLAKENFKENGNNRVILATDGDFNIGASSNAEMERLIEEKRKDGVFLTVLGFGMGNYKDSKMETIADKGNGNYAYIDNILEARKVLVNEFGGTLFTIAKDVKIQVEFNPAKVKAYRLIGYENRLLRDEDFNDDKKDAGELGSGHTVTALYEIIPVGVESKFIPVDDLKYQETKISAEAHKSKELMTVKLRYKEPAGETSKLIVHGLVDKQIALDKSSENFRWSAAVAGFGMLLRDSEFKGDLNYSDVLQLARSAKGSDPEGYRIEFINLVKGCEVIARR